MSKNTFIVGRRRTMALLAAAALSVSFTAIPVPVAAEASKEQPVNRPDPSPFGFNTFNCWFDALTQYTHEADASPTPPKVADLLADISGQCPNLRNTRKLRDAVQYIVSGPLPDMKWMGLRDALTRHIDAIIDHSFSDEFRKHFSRTLAGVRDKTDISAASTLFDLVHQATTYPAPVSV